MSIFLVFCSECGILMTPIKGEKGDIKYYYCQECGETAERKGA